MHLQNVLFYPVFSIKEIIIMDLLGNEIVNYKDINENRKSINLTELKQGIYFAKIITASNDIFVKKFIKI